MNKILLGNLYGQNIYIDLEDIKDEAQRQVVQNQINKWFSEADLALREKNYEKGLLNEIITQTNTSS